jgi:hypothetical protein
VDGAQSVSRRVDSAQLDQGLQPTGDLAVGEGRRRRSDWRGMTGGREEGDVDGWTVVGLGSTAGGLDIIIVCSAGEMIQCTDNCRYGILLAVQAGDHGWSRTYVSQHVIS